MRVEPWQIQSGSQTANYRQSKSRKDARMKIHRHESWMKTKSEPREIKIIIWKEEVEEEQQPLRQQQQEQLQ